MQNEQVRIYKYSGRIGLMGFGLVLMVLFGALSLSLSVVYVLATSHIPFVYINFLLTACFGAVCGYAVALGGKLGKVRNVPLYFIVGLLVGIAAEYCQWVVWVHIHSGYRVWIFAPDLIYNYISNVAVKGLWTVFNVTVKGRLLYTVWIIEGLIIILCAMLGAYGFLISSPFCESCKRWFKKKENLVITPLDPIVEPTMIVKQLLAGDCRALFALNIMSSRGNAYTKLKVSSCPKCDKFHILSLYSMKVLYANYGEREYENPIIENLIITPEMFHSMMNRYFCQTSEPSQLAGSPLRSVNV